MNRLLRNAISITLLAWLAGAAGAAVQSGMQCPINGFGPVHRSNPTRHAYSLGSRRDRLQVWRERRQQRLQEWRAQRRWSAAGHRGLRPEPPPFPERFRLPPSFADYPAFARVAPPPGYWYGLPPPNAYPVPPARWSAAPHRPTEPESAGSDYPVREVRSGVPGYRADRPGNARLILEGRSGIPPLRRVQM